MTDLDRRALYASTRSAEAVQESGAVLREALAVVTGRGAEGRAAEGAIADSAARTTGTILEHEAVVANATAPNKDAIR